MRAFVTGFFSLRITVSGFFRVVAYVSDSFLRWLCNIPLRGQTKFDVSADGRLGRFDVLAIVNGGAVTLHRSVSVDTHAYFCGVDAQEQDGWVPWALCA